MIDRFYRRQKFQSILGHDIDKPRITLAGFALIFFYLGVPAMLTGSLIDLLVQLTTGNCVGVWCLFIK